MAASDKKRVINANILLYGPGAAGKTSNLRFIQRKLKPGQRGEIEPRTQEGDPSVTYEYLPIQLGPLMGYETNLFIYTVPAGEAALETRLNLLPDAAGVAFIAHSGESELDRNIDCLEALKEELRYFGLDYDSFPLLFQYNFRDVPDALATEVLNRHLNPEARPVFEAVSSTGDGVRATFAAISKLAVRRVRLQLIQSQGESSSSSSKLGKKEASTVVEEPPVLAPPPIRAGAATNDTKVRVEAPVGDDFRAENNKVSDASPPVKRTDDTSGVNPARVSAETGGVRIENLRQSPRLSDFDLETSGEFRRVSREEIFPTNIADFDSGEPMMVEAVEATDDDDEYEDGDLSMPPTMLTEEEQQLLAQSNRGNQSALVLPDIPSMPQFNIAPPAAASGDLQIHVVADDEEEEQINLLGVGDSFNLDDANFAIEDEGEELDLDELGLMDDGGDDLFDDALELTDDEAEEAEAAEDSSEDVSSFDFSGASAAESEDSSRGEVSTPFVVESEMSADDDLAQEDDDDEAGPNTIAITALPELNTADAFEAPQAAEDIDSSAIERGNTKAEVLSWGEVIRVDAQNILLPVTVNIPTLGKTVELRVKLNVEELIGD